MGAPDSLVPSNNSLNQTRPLLCHCAMIRQIASDACSQVGTWARRLAQKGYIFERFAFIKITCTRWWLNRGYGMHTATPLAWYAPETAHVDRHPFLLSCRLAIKRPCCSPGWRQRKRRARTWCRCEMTYFHGFGFASACPLDFSELSLKSGGSHC
jgi:hypothetical protein